MLPPLMRRCISLKKVLALLDISAWLRGRQIIRHSAITELMKTFAGAMPV